MMVSVLVFSERPGYMLLLQKHDKNLLLAQETGKNLTMKRKRKGK